jgi:NDP-sugar pyrophosphorylase family protein
MILHYLKDVLINSDHKIDLKLKEFLSYEKKNGDNNTILSKLN